MSVRKSWENYRQIWKIYSKPLEKFKHRYAPKCFRTILCFVAFVYNWYFFRTAVLRRLFDIRFSYKHCIFSRVCLLVEMASKTMTRSIADTYQIKFELFWNYWFMRSGVNTGKWTWITWRKASALPTRPCFPPKWICCKALRFT